MRAPQWLDPRRTFGTRLTIIIVSLLLLTLAGATLVTLRVARANLTDQVGENFQGHAESLSELINLYLTSNINEVQQLAASHELVTAATERNATYQGSPGDIRGQLIALDEQWVSALNNDPLIQSVVVAEAHEVDPVAHSISQPTGHVLAEFQDLFEEHTEVVFTDGYGGTIAATTRTQNYFRADENWWQAAWNNGKGSVQISTPEYDVSAEFTALLIAVPVVDDSGQVVGVLCSMLRINELYALIADTVLGETGYGALLNANGASLFDPRAGHDYAVSFLPAQLRQEIIKPEASSFATRDAVFGQALLSGGSPATSLTQAEATARDAVARLGWHVIFRQDASEALSTLNLIERVAWLSGGVAMLIGTVAAMFVGQAVTRPLTKLAEAARDIGAGKLDTPLPKPGPDEIGGLTSAFHTMTSQLRQMIGTLQKRTDELSLANASLTQEAAERKRAERALMQRKEQLEIHTREIESVNAHLAETQEALEQSLETERERARRDPLTGVLNHAAIVDELRHLVSVRGDARSHAVAMVDLDGLKAVNDTFGHQVGDKVLVVVAKALAREGVTVGRYGGDEFVVLLPGRTREEAERYQDDVMTDLQSRSVEDPESGATIPVKTSIGLAIYPEEADTVTELIALSDSAMYAVKRQRAVEQGNVAPGREDERASQMVGQIVPLLTSPGDLSEKLNRAAKRLSAANGYDVVDISFYDPEDEASFAHWALARVDDRMLIDWANDEHHSTSSAHPMRQVLERTRRPVMIEDFASEERISEDQRKLLISGGLRSGVVVPMIWHDRVVGSLAAGSRRPAAFTPRDAQYLVTVATQITAVMRMETLVSDLQTATEDLGHAQEETVLLLAAAAEAHDHTTGLHLQSVRSLAEALAREMGSDEEDARLLGLAAVLHDIGKIRVPDSILASPGKLTPDQWEVMRNHTVWGASFLTGHAGFELATEIARSHHEQWDGTGYPDGLSKSSIPEGATIVSVADAFDAMTHDRPYRAAQPVDEAIKEIVKYAGKQFNPAVVAALQRLDQRTELSLVHPDAPLADAA